jgi:AcrR family transcriptional regulator
VTARQRVPPVRRHDDVVAVAEDRAPGDASSAADAAADPSTGGDAPVKTLRGELTRTRILNTALDMFRERGYDETTMRAVADRAGVALGNAYYYFRSKEHLIQAFYGRTHQEHLMMCRPILERERSFRARLAAVMHAKLDTLEPYHRFAGVLFKTAADPASPLHPLSAASRPVRAEATGLFREVVDGSTIRLPDDLRQELPELLWMYHMGVVLFWIHDETSGRMKSGRLVDRSVALIDRLIGLARLPGLGPVRRAALDLIRDAR